MTVPTCGVSQTTALYKSLTDCQAKLPGSRGLPGIAKQGEERSILSISAFYCYLLLTSNTVTSFAHPHLA